MSRDRDHRSPWHWITRLALGLLLAIVITRFITEEIIRDPSEAVPGGLGAPRAPGAAAGLVLDLLSVLPALAILFRAAFDSSYRLKHRWSYLPMFALGLLAVISTAWSSDKFLAAVTASHFLAALCLLWAASQLVHNWLRLRLVAAVSFGLLLILVVQSVAYRAIDSGENVRYWNDHKSEILEQNNWQPGSFAAQQFEHKLLAGELSGFFNSPNTFAAVGVLLFVVSAGLGIQKLTDNTSKGWLAIPLIAAVSVLWIIIEAKSKTAAVTPLLAIFLFTAVIKLRPRIKQRPAHFYWMGVATVFAAVVAVVGHGLYHGGLFPGHLSNSLDFRWKYWIASAHLFAQHPLVGIGWSNFGLYYTSARVPAAAEEIKDPHNFLIRFFVELGIIGGLLTILWQLRLWWEVTQSPPIGAKENAHLSTIKIAIAVAAAGITLGILTNIDFTQSPVDIVLEGLRQLLYLMVLVLGIIAGLMLSPHQQDPDTRPAPLLRYCILIAVGIFVIHNLIDFSMFEFGPMSVLFLLLGSALGTAGGHGNKSPNQSRGLPIALLLFCTLALAIAAGAFVFPIISAEQFAYEGDEAIRSASPKNPAEIRSQYAIAADRFHNALENVPYNSDYAFRCAKARFGSGDFTGGNQMIAITKQLNPRLIDTYLLQADAELQKPNPDPTIVRSDFDIVLQLNPNDVSLHTQYGEALDRFGQFADAAVQYQQALSANAALPPDEPKRISPEQTADLQSRISLDQSKAAKSEIRSPKSE